MNATRKVFAEVWLTLAAIARGIGRTVRVVAEVAEGLVWLCAVAGVLYLALTIAVRQGAAPGLAPVLQWINAHAVAVLAFFRARGRQS